MTTIPAAIFVTTQIVMEQMTDDEVLAHTLGLQLGHADMSGTLGYAKSKPLFTQHLPTGDQMHELTKEAFLRLAAERLNL